jgi:DNA repair exonuclease SbcCD ATPase subunit
MAKQIDNDLIKKLKEELNNKIKDIVLKYKTLENKYNELLPLNNIVKQLQLENQQKDIIINNLRNEIDSIKSQLNNAQEENKTKFKQMSGISNIKKLKETFSEIKCDKF